MILTPFVTFFMRRRLMTGLATRFIDKAIVMRLFMSFCGRVQRRCFVRLHTLSISTDLLFFYFFFGLINHFINLLMVMMVIVCVSVNFMIVIRLIHMLLALVARIVVFTFVMKLSTRNNQLHFRLL